MTAGSNSRGNSESEISHTRAHIESVTELVRLEM
jgi:hypothetical protein